MKLYRVECKLCHHGPFSCRCTKTALCLGRNFDETSLRWRMGERHKPRWAVKDAADDKWGPEHARFAMTTQELMAEVFAEAIVLETFQVIEIIIPDEWVIRCLDGQAVYHAQKAEKIRQLVKENLLQLVAESAA